MESDYIAWRDRELFPSLFQSLELEQEQNCHNKSTSNLDQAIIGSEQTSESGSVRIEAASLSTRVEATLQGRHRSRRAGAGGGARRNNGRIGNLTATAHTNTNGDDVSDASGHGLVDLEELGSLINNGKRKLQPLKVKSERLLLTATNGKDSEADADNAEADVSDGGVVPVPVSGRREMLTSQLRAALTKQGYKLIGTHSGVKLCRWVRGLIHSPPAVRIPCPSPSPSPSISAV